MTKMTLVCLGSSLEVLHTLFSFLICFVKMTVTEEFSAAEDVSRQTTVGSGCLCFRSFSQQLRVAGWANLKFLEHKIELCQVQALSRCGSVLLKQRPCLFSGFRLNDYFVQRLDHVLRQLG